MRLLAIKLQDFQCHEKLVVVFDKGITTVVGASDTGKSAILRALRWVCQNHIGGDEFVREGQKTARVALKVEHAGKEYVIVREKGGQQNLYFLNGKEYRSFQTGVPADIEALLSLNDINFQGQHDSPFWFNETAGEVSRRLNAVIDLSVIDSALSYAAAQVRLAQERKAVSEERLLTAEEQLATLAPQRQRVEDFTDVQTKAEAHEKLNNDCNSLGRLAERIHSHHTEWTDSKARAEAGRDAASLGKESFRQVQQCSRVAELIGSLIESRDNAVPPPDFDSVLTPRKQWVSLNRQVEDLKSLVSSIVLTADKATNLQNRSEEAEKEFHRKVKGKECPLCQKELQ